MVQVHGNKEVIDLAKQIVRFAKTENLNWLGFVGAKAGDQIGYGFAGNCGALDQGMKGLKVLFQNVKARYEERVTGVGDPNKDASYHEFNLATDPINYDFLIWLIDAEMI